MKTKTEILAEFALFSVPTGGIGGWITDQTHDDVFARLGRLDEEPLPAVQLNQLLVLGREAPVGDGFFRYYWLQAAPRHPYSVRDLPGFTEEWLQSEGNIISLVHLKWGLYRLYVDALLYFGNVRTAFRKLRDLPIGEIETFFTRRRLDTEAIKRRGPSLPLKPIAKDNRYLISEMACKSYGDGAGADGDLRSALVQAYKVHAAVGNPSPTIRDLLENRLFETEWGFAFDPDAPPWDELDGWPTAHRWEGRLGSLHRLSGGFIAHSLGAAARLALALQRSVQLPEPILEDRVRMYVRGPFVSRLVALDSLVDQPWEGLTDFISTDTREQSSSA